MSADAEKQLRGDGGCAEEEIYSGATDCGADPTFPLTSLGAEGEHRLLRSRAVEAPHEGICGCYLCKYRSRESGSDSPCKPCLRPELQAKLVGTEGCMDNEGAL